MNFAEIYFAYYFFVIICHFGFVLYRLKSCTIYCYNLCRVNNDINYYCSYCVLKEKTANKEQLYAY